MKVKSESEVAKSCPTFSDPMDCSLPGSSIPGIFQVIVLEWGAIALSEIYEARHPNNRGSNMGSQGSSPTPGHTGVGKWLPTRTAEQVGEALGHVSCPSGELAAPGAKRK